jgi:hypothetical protein
MINVQAKIQITTAGTSGKNTQNQPIVISPINLRVKRMRKTSSKIPIVSSYEIESIVNPTSAKVRITRIATS